MAWHHDYVRHVDRRRVADSVTPMISRREIKARTITQGNDTRCFRAGNNANTSRHNKSAKRQSSRLLRRLCKEEIEAQGGA